MDKQIFRFEITPENFAADSEQAARKLFGAEYERIDGVRQAVICDLIANCGSVVFTKNNKLYSAIRGRDFELASDELVLISAASGWYGPRHVRLASLMRKGAKNAAL